MKFLIYKKVHEYTEKFNKASLNELVYFEGVKSYWV